MASDKQLTFYTAAYSPHCHRVKLALDEAKLNYTAYEFETHGSKPDWYYGINPIGKIPAITYGGPLVPPDQPSPESAKLVESLALLEFIADICPASGLLPSDPVARARARAFVSIYQSYVNDAFRDVFFIGGPGTIDNALQAMEHLQRALPPDGGFAAGTAFTIADCAVAPTLVRMMFFLRIGLGAFTPEDGERLRAEVMGDKFARYRQYVQDLQERPCFKKDWDEDAQLEIWKNHRGLRREASAQSES